MFSGCKPGGLETNVVEGTVQWNGQPVEGALVTFQPQDESGASAVGTTEAQGKYALTASAGEFGAGAVAGRYKVLITKIPTGAAGRPSTTTELPGIYAEVGTTPFNAEVKKGKNTFDFTLEGEAAAKPK